MVVEVFALVDRVVLGLLFLRRLLCGSGLNLYERYKIRSLGSDLALTPSLFICGCGTNTLSFAIICFARTFFLE